jgi:hypothetical protein
MRFSGKLKLGNVDVQISDRPIVLKDIELEYNSETTITEVKEMVEIIKEVPDIVATVVRKFVQYHEEFSGEPIVTPEDSNEKS